MTGGRAKKAPKSIAIWRIVLAYAHDRTHDRWQSICMIGDWRRPMTSPAADAITLPPHGRALGKIVVWHTDQKDTRWRALSKILEGDTAQRLCARLTGGWRGKSISKV